MWLTLIALFYFLLVQRLERSVFGTSTVDMLWNWLVVSLTRAPSQSVRYVEIGSAPKEPATLPPMSERDWLALLNHRPDTHPHLLIAGKTGSGKTTFSRAVLSQRTGDVCILNPKNNIDDWRPLPYVAFDSDGTFSTMAATLDDLRRELIRRTGDETPLTVICDDASIIAQSSETKQPYLDFIRAAARLGRSKRLRLLVLAHETTAAAMGIHGEAGLLDNFTRIAVDKSHDATIILDEPQPLATRAVPALARDGLAQLQPWAVPVPDEGARNDENTGTGIFGIPDTNVENEYSERDELILLAIREDWTFNRLYRAIGGNRTAVSRRWQELKREKE
jgi:hypothetical protein